MGAVTQRPILIMAGGTGGHVYPALAVAECLRARGNTPLWLGTRHGLESRLIPPQGYTLLPIHACSVRGRSWAGKIAALFYSGAGLLQTLWLLLRYRPALTLGMGGYVCAAGGVAAWLLRIPLCIHEQNAIPGLTNRWLARLATVVMESFPGSFPAARHARVTGNPVRAGLSGSRMKRADARLHLLVLGGSQGAQILNRILPPAIGALQGRLALEVHHQTGPGMVEQTRARYTEFGVQAQLEEYIEDMEAAYRRADLAVCRAGATTLAELSVVGLAAILVPYPFAADDHQTANARFLCRRGRALLLPERVLDARRLATLLFGLSHDRERLRQMAAGQDEPGNAQAAEQIAALCLRYAHG